MKEVVPDILNYPLMYFICLGIVWYSSLICILCTCLAAVPFPSSSSSSLRLVRYLMLGDSAWFLATFLPKYSDWRPVIISVSLKLNATCGN